LPTSRFSRSPISHRPHGQQDILPATYKTEHRDSSTVCLVIRIPSSVPPTGVWTRLSITAYDAMGRITGEQQCTPSNCTNGAPYSPSYSYDSSGNLVGHSTGLSGASNLGGISLIDAYDGAGRLQSITSNWSDSKHPAVLFSAQTTQSGPCSGTTTSAYAPFGGLMNAQLGANLMINRSYDNGLRIACESDMGGLPSQATSGATAVSLTGSEQTK